MMGILTFGMLFGILISSTTLAYTDVEYSIAIKYVTKVITYQQASSNCRSDGKELCSAKTICKDGVMPYGGLIPGDNWVPVADSSNEWLQVGTAHSPCILHSSFGSKPAWGLKHEPQNFKGHLFCCKIKRKEDNVVIKQLSNTISYQQAVTSCRNHKKELCTSKEICKDGKTPHSGPLIGDHWIPVLDSQNEWLQIGNSPHRPCIFHSHLGRKPSWGLTNAAGSYKGIVYCCQNKPSVLRIIVKSVTSKITYIEAVTDCKSNGRRLCNSKEICKDGKTPVSGVIAGDHWVPVKDSSNEWLQLGNTHKPCTLHSHLGSKPNWGVIAVSRAYKGYLFCCKL